MKQWYANWRGRRGGAPGFSLLEIAIGMALLGLLVGGALLLGGKLRENNLRDETRDHLLDLKSAVLEFARKNGRFPMMDIDSSVLFTGDGVEDMIAVEANYDANTISSWYPFGWIPYKTIGRRGRDPFNKTVQYFVNWQLAKEGAVKPCNALNRFYMGKVDLLATYVYYYGAQSYWNDYNLNPAWHPRLRIENIYYVPVAAVIISSSQNQEFNKASDNKGNNIDGYKTNYSPFYKASQTETFDDIVEYISISEAYSALNCR